jgi:hypothetical protein
VLTKGNYQGKWVITGGNHIQFEFWVIFFFCIQSFESYILNVFFLTIDP